MPADSSNREFLIYAANNSTNEGYLYLWSLCSTSVTSAPLGSLNIDANSFIAFDADSNLIIASPSSQGFYICSSSSASTSSPPSSSYNCSFVKDQGDTLGKTVYELLPTTAPGEVIVCSTSGLSLVHLVAQSYSQDVVEAFASMPINASSIPCIAAAFTPSNDSAEVDVPIAMSIAFSPPADPNIEYGYVYMWRYVSFSLTDVSDPSSMIQLWNNYSVGGIIRSSPLALSSSL